MARPVKNTLASLLNNLKDEVNKTSSLTDNGKKIPSILEFCDSQEYLGLPYQTPSINLFPVQRLMLKCFYRGSVGNTGPDMQLTQEELDQLKQLGLNHKDNGNVLSKIISDATFRELVLVWGRRSGKDFVVSIIALYEAMKLLETEGGDPYGKYGIPRMGNPITILTVATAAAQAEVAFNEIKSKLMQSKYFRDKFISEGVMSNSIFLLTPKDKEENEDRKRRRLPLEKGSIEIRAGHSNSDSLLGIQCYVLLLDEVAVFKTTEGSSSGHKIYEGLLPSLNTFVRVVKLVNPETGKEEEHRIYDSKVITISSPRGKDGILWEMFNDADNSSERLACRLPTWVVNPKYDRFSLRKTFQQFSEERFMMEFGAEFSGSGGSSFFSETQVSLMFSHTMRFREVGQPGIVYFAHLDPASTSNNYALAVCHREMRMNEEKKKIEQIVVLDHLKFWSPLPNKPINMNLIDDYVLSLNRRFHLGLVTYDDFHSLSSIEKMKKAGIPCRMTKYNRYYKMKVYSELEKLINENRIISPYDPLLEAELVNLQRRYDGGRGFSVYPNRESDTPTDDLCDALAGAAFNCVIAENTKLAHSQLINLPNSGGNNRPFMSMQGTPIPTNNSLLNRVLGINGINASKISF